MIVKATSPQRAYQPERQNKYYQEEAKLFEGMTEYRDTRRLQVHGPAPTQPIGEWFKLFLKTVEDETMLKELWKSLKVAISVEQEDIGQPCETWSKKASRRVKWNKKQSGKEF